LPFFLLIECFCNGEKADRNGAEEIAHPQSNHKEITSLISKFTACSTRNVDMVRSIGADQVIEYTRVDFTKNGQRHDLIFDAVGNRSVSDYKRALSPQWYGCRRRVYKPASFVPSSSSGIMGIKDRE